MRRLLAAAHALGGPILRRLDPERAHDLTVRALARLPLPPPPKVPPALGVRAFGLSFAHPLGLAAGFDKQGAVTDALLRLGFAHVEAGGVTPRPQPGNPRPRVFRLPADGAVINRYGLNSEGMESVAARLARRDPHLGPVGINLGANKESADRAADYAALASRLAGVADWLTVNVSSPNTPGLRDLQAEAALDELLARVTAARDACGHATPVLLKLAPDLDEHGLDGALAVALRRGVAGIIIANTTVARPSSLRDQATAREAGGLSGRPLFQPSTRLLARAFLRAGAALPLVGVGGIHDGPTALAKIEAGATLLQLYTALIYEGPALIPRILDHLERAVAAAGAASIADLVGRRAGAWARGEARVSDGPEGALQ